MIEIKNLYKSYGKRQILKGVTTTVERGKITAVAGPNGSGKTTLLKCILSLLRYEQGKISIDGKDILESQVYKNTIGYVPQNSALPANLSIKEMAVMLKELRGIENTRYEELAELLALGTELEKKSSSLSGGTKQKAGILLGLLFDPALLILDEPVAFLDPTASATVKEELQNQVDAGKSVLFTSHNMHEISEIADTLIYFLDGRIVWQGSPQKLMEETFSQNLEKAVSHLLKKHHEPYTKNLKIYIA